MINFESEPAVGHVLALRGNDYVYRGPVDHVTMAGVPITLWAWETKCEACGVSFEVRSTPSIEYLSRRCAGCRPFRAPSPKGELRRLRDMFAQLIPDAEQRKIAEASFAIIQQGLTDALPALKREEKRRERREQRKGRAS